MDDQLPASSHRYTARALLFLIYSFWFLALAIGTLAYAGNQIKADHRHLPLQHFDKLFRNVGAGLLFLPWTLRAIIKSGLHALGHGHRENIWIPAGVYAVQATLRALLYQLHRAGIILSPDKWAKDIGSWHGHLPHIMSDHILLAATVVGGLACEAVVASLALTSLSKNNNNNKKKKNTSFSIPALVLQGCTAMSTVLALTVSVECFYTARYFHPPSEIVFAAALGLAVFQVPLLMYIARVLKAHEKRHMRYGESQKET